MRLMKQELFLFRQVLTKRCLKFTQGFHQDDEKVFMYIVL